MKVTSSYAVHVQDHRQSLKATVSLYRAAVAFMIDVVDKEWDTLPPICAAGGKLGQHALEHMIHKTKGFPKPKYNFDEKFYKFPSYFRRAPLQWLSELCPPIARILPIGKLAESRAAAQTRLRPECYARVLPRQHERVRVHAPG